MSAFIVSKETMDKVCSGLSMIRYAPDQNQFDMSPTEDWTSAQGKKLYQLNLQSVQIRYPRDTKETAPGPIETSTIHDGYKLMRMSHDKVACYKAMRCLKYQCSEGAAAETELYKNFDEAILMLADQIIRNLPSYNIASWD